MVQDLLHEQDGLELHKAETGYGRPFAPVDAFAKTFNALREHDHVLFGEASQVS